MIDQINNKFSFNVDLLLQTTIGTVICSVLEGLFGLVLNVWLNLNIWDYSNLSTPSFFYGQVNLLFCLAWFALSCVGIILCDAINYYVFDLYVRPYYKLFGKVVFRLPEIK